MAVIYTRISYDKFKDQEREGEGVARQEAACRNLAETLELPVTDVYRDNNASATKKEPRAEFEQMLKDRPDAIIVWDQDRLLRKPQDLERVIALDIPVYSVNGGFLDLKSSTGRAVARTVAVWSLQEIEHKEERQKEQRQDALTKGIPTPGKCRFGYLRADSDIGRRGNTKIREDEAEIVRELFQGVLDGKSIRGMAQNLTKRKVPFHGKVTPWLTGRVRGILANPAYQGAVVTAEGWEVSPHVEAIIEPDVWERVQAILKDPTRRVSPGSARKHLLSGLVRCGTCGAKMHHTNGAYYCKTPVTGHPTIKREYLESRVIDELVMAFLVGPRALMAAPEGVQDSRPIQERLAAIREESAQLQQDRSDGLLDADTVRKALVKLKVERVELEAALEQIRMQQGARGVLATIAGTVIERAGDKKISLSRGADVSEAKAKVREAFELLDLDDKRNLIEGLMNVTLYPGRGTNRINVHHKIAVGLNENEIPA